MKKLTVVLIFILALCFNNIAYAESIKINAKSCILIDGKTGQIIYEQNSHQKLHPASTTKVMTAILAIENGKMDQMMTASNAAVKDIGFNGSNAGIVGGEILSLKDLLHTLLIKSANDSANIIAENISPTRKDFIDLMNNKAVELGATDTSFTNTCGLDKSDGHPNHMTSAADMSKFAKYAMTLPKFREVVVEKTYIMPETNKHPASYWPKEFISTTNRFLMNYASYKSNLYTITGIKTGYTAAAACNLVSSGIGPDGMELISVVYGVNDQDTLYKETKKLLEYGFNTFAIANIVNLGDVAYTTQVENAKDDESNLNLVFEKPVSFPMPKERSEWKLEKKVYHDTKITAPVNKGDVLGFVEFYIGDQKIASENLVAETSITEAPPLIFKLPVKSPNYLKIIYNSLLLILGFYIGLLLLRVILKRASKLYKQRNPLN